MKEWSIKLLLFRINSPIFSSPITSLTSKTVNMNTLVINLTPAVKPNPFFKSTRPEQFKGIVEIVGFDEDDSVVCKLHKPNGLGGFYVSKYPVIRTKRQFARQYVQSDENPTEGITAGMKLIN